MKKLIEIEKEMSREEVYRALFDGRVFITASTDKIFYDSTKSEPYRYISGAESEPLNTAWEFITHEEIEVEWYENIPEWGALCWVWNDDESFRAPAFVYSYNPQYEQRFQCCSETSTIRDLDDYVFKNAALMTSSEVQKHIFSE